MAHAQIDNPQPIHWAYSTFFGTGAYETSTGAEAFVATLRLSRQWREATLDSQGHRRIGVKFRLPISIGVQDFDALDPVAALRFDNVSTLSVVPGADIEIPMTERWSLKPFGYLGWGTELDGEGSAWIYWTGVKNRLRFGSDDFEWALINSLTYVGYSVDNTNDDNVALLFTGFEFARPLADKKIGGEQVRLHWHVGYTDYLRELDFDPAASSAPVRVGEEWELGAAFSTAERQLRVWRFRFDRVGLAYRFSRDREVRGIGIVFSSLFDR